MSQETISELLDNVEQRIHEESQIQGIDYSYLIWISDPKSGSGDMRNVGDVDSLLAMSVRAQHRITHQADEEEVISEHYEEIEAGTHTGKPLSGMVNCPSCKKLILLKVGHPDKVVCDKCGCFITILRDEGKPNFGDKVHNAGCRARLQVPGGEMEGGSDCLPTCDCWCHTPMFQLCDCGHEKHFHFFGDNRDLSTPCGHKGCDCKMFRTPVVKLKEDD
jgi:hypothetical protein